jgi:hypothetical protein
VRVRGFLLGSDRAEEDAGWDSIQPDDRWSGD